MNSHQFDDSEPTRAQRMTAQETQEVIALWQQERVEQGGLTDSPALPDVAEGLDISVEDARRLLEKVRARRSEEEKLLEQEQTEAELEQIRLAEEERKLAEVRRQRAELQRQRAEEPKQWAEPWEPQTTIIKQKTDKSSLQSGSTVKDASAWVLLVISGLAVIVLLYIIVAHLR